LKTFLETVSYSSCNEDADSGYRTIEIGYAKNTESNKRKTRIENQTSIRVMS
jgi:hypothetical protein